MAGNAMGKGAVCVSLDAVMLNFFRIQETFGKHHPCDEARHTKDERSCEYVAYHAHTPSPVERITF